MSFLVHLVYHELMKNSTVYLYLFLLSRRVSTCISKIILPCFQKWEAEINSVSNGKPKITIENNVDWEGPPENFVYISDYVTSGGISIPDDPPVGCSCTNCYDNKNGCCAAAFGVKFAYNQNGRYESYSFVVFT